MLARCASNYFAYMCVCVCQCSRLLVSSARDLGVIMFLLQSYHMDLKQSLTNFCLAYSCQMVDNQFKYVSMFSVPVNEPKQFSNPYSTISSVRQLMSFCPSPFFLFCG